VMIQGLLTTPREIVGRRGRHVGHSVARNNYCVFGVT